MRVEKYNKAVNDRLFLKCVPTELGDDTLKKINDKLRKFTTVDWQVRESVRAKLRILIRRTLQRYKCTQQKAPAAIKLIMQQAKALSNSWSN
ncbi:type I restriction enzyme endonuclease domain-containing protein [Marinobacter sp. ATCH36]|uniref:type I restriction enzyme endonuclease domain-containing protein n=1 Tax=Marinobacter sp. ATCH36 TaxID=2945106 RepID=UPI002021FE3A|nr:type I restriction enzyme endonuclease domain-containing protein [Marinobacter sp. ATCH36]MCL7942920.1 DUF3387 domain-containing protein [Marinobacter sp. ATCH36]